MLHIYLRRKDIEDIEKFIDCPEIYSNEHIYDMRLDEKDLQDIFKIDKAKFDADSNMFKTPMGMCGVASLSTGAKTKILLNHFRGKIVNINSCGDNIFRMIFEEEEEEYTIYFDRFFGILIKEGYCEKRVVLHWNNTAKIKYIESIVKYKL